MTNEELELLKTKSEIIKRMEHKDFPSIQEEKWLQKYTPKTWAIFFQKKYILPGYRAPQYMRQDLMNYFDWSTIMGFPFLDRIDEVMNACFCNIAGAMARGRPTMFLEIELGDPLLHSKLPEDMEVADIKWRWPHLRIYLPKNLITMGNNFLSYLDIGLLEEKEARVLPEIFQAEANYACQHFFKDQEMRLDYRSFNFHYPDRAIILSGVMNLSESVNINDLTTYAMVKPFKGYSIKKIKEMTEHLKSEWASDKADDAITSQMEHLAFQILLFLAAYPLEYLPETILRRPAAHGQRQISGLYSARFVGASQIRPDRRGAHPIARMMTMEEYHQKHHWRMGHWKRQVCGPEGKDRRLIWINPYEAGRLEEEEAAKKKNGQA